MGQCASFKNQWGQILGYTLLNDMSQGTGYELLSYRDFTQYCLWGSGGSSRYYLTNVQIGIMTDGWCKSDPDACFIEALYQERDPQNIYRYCWVQGTGSRNILSGYHRSRLCYILPLERNGNGLCATIDGSIVPMYFLPYIIGLVVLILLCVNLILWVWFRKRNKKQTKKQKYTKIQFDDEVTTTDCE
eukprot:422867_1